MFSLLTEKQSSELNKAIVQYLIPIFSDESETKNSTGVLSNQKANDKENIQAQNADDFSVMDQISKKLVGVPVTKFVDDTQGQGSDQSTVTIPSNYLEKKWTTVLRLQKKIFDLESELRDSKSTIESLEKSLAKAKRSGRGNSDDEEYSKLYWVPSRLKSVLKMHRSSVTSVAIHPFKPIMASGSSDGQIIIWNLLDLSEPERIIKNAHTRSINSLSFQSTEIQLDNVDLNTQTQRVLLASGSSDLLVKVWDIDSIIDKNNKNLTPIRVLVGHDHIVSCVKFNPANPTTLLSCSRDKSVKVWDVLSGWCNKSFVGHSDWVRSLDINENGKYVLSCSNDHSIRLSYIENGIGIGLLIGHQQVVETTVFLPMKANKYLDKLASEKLGLKLDSSSSNSVLNNPIYEKIGYKYCCSGGRDDIINVWLLPTPLFSTSNTPVPSTNPRGLLIMSMRGHSSWVRNLEVHPNGYMLMSCSDDKTLKMWDLRKLSDENNNSFDCLSVLKSHEGFVNTFQFAPPVLNNNHDDTNQENENENEEDENEKVDEEVEKMRIIDKGMRCYLISGSSDNTIRIWN